MILDKIFKNENGEFISLFDFVTNNGSFDNYIYTLAEAHAIDLIAKTIAKCEIQTFELKDKKIQKNKGNLYWTLNLQPNFNENGTSFIYKLLTKLLTNGTALVIKTEKINSNYLYVAEEYTTTDDIMKFKSFNNVVITDNEGNSKTLNKTFNQDNTIYFSLKNKKLSVASEKFKNSTQKILKAVQKSLQASNIPKWRLKNPGGQPTIRDAETGKELSYSEYKNKLTEGLFSEEESVVLLSEIFDLINLNEKNNKSNNDYLSTVKDISDAVARKWSIPLEIFYGNKTDKSTSNEDFITFAVEPYFEEIEDGFNVYLVGKESYLKGEYVKFNRLNITHKDLIDKASGWDKLISNGFSFNQLSSLLGLPTINEEWANKHYITKNYANVEGGEENG